jgi:hypothetical protein
MKVPGRAWLQFEADPIDENRTTLTQSALFEPKGLLGFLYWWSMYPIHLFIFSDMVRAVGRDAESIASKRSASSPAEPSDSPDAPPPSPPPSTGSEHRHGQQPATSESA